MSPHALLAALDSVSSIIMSYSVGAGLYRSVQIDATFARMFIEGAIAAQVGILDECEVLDGVMYLA